jgi:hypothetical protein
VGTDFFRSVIKGNNANTVNGFNIKNLHTISNSKDQPLIGNSRTNNRYNAAFVRGYVGFRDYLFAEFTLRNDWFLHFLRIITQSFPIYVIKASSVLLARAEAADRGWTSETANTETLYAAGIAASFEQWGLAVPDAAYFAGPNVDLTASFGTGANLDKIATQQWVAFYPDGNQGWANWGRTNIPALLPAPDASNDPKEIPRRYMYGTSDYSLTKTGVEAAVANILPAGVGEKMNGRVWWDKQ